MRDSRCSRSLHIRSYSFLRRRTGRGRSSGRPASPHNTYVAMCKPNMAGSGPSIGNIRTRKSRSGASSSTEPLASSASASGRCATSLGTSVEYTTELFARLRSRTARLRPGQYRCRGRVRRVGSAIWTHVGSDLVPSPMNENTSTLFRTQCARSSTFVPILSIASSPTRQLPSTPKDRVVVNDIKSTYRQPSPRPREGLHNLRHSSIRGSTCTNGMIPRSARATHSFGEPTSASPAVAWRFREESVT
jgi:hypothetical protein